MERKPHLLRDAADINLKNNVTEQINLFYKIAQVKKTKTKTNDFRLK